MGTSTQGGALMADTMLARAKGLVPLISAQAAAAEEAGQLTDVVVEALHDSGLYRLWVPAVLGGAELDPASAAEIVEQISYADPSTSWVYFAGAILAGTSAAYYGDEAIEVMYSGERVPILAGHGARAGVAVPSDGGFVCSGSYSFGSGIKHAQWTHNQAIVEGTGEARIYTTRVDEVTLDWDSWDGVLGLRATGSIDYAIDGVFVPEAFTHIAAVDTPARGGPLYRLGIPGFISCCHGAWAIGLGRRMLDELTTLLVAKAGRVGTQAESTAFLEQYERAEARLRSARALFYETWREIGDTLSRDEPLTEQQLTLYRLALTNATWSIHEVAMFVHTAAGTAAMRPGVLQRSFRDMETGVQHITSGPAVRHNVGRVLAGLGTGKRWLFLDLVDAV